MTGRGRDADVLRPPPSHAPAARTRSAAQRRLVDWWVTDLPPMHGLLRFVVYGGLLAIALEYEVSPLRGIESYERTSPEMFRVFGLLDLLGVTHISPPLLRAVSLVTQLAWVCAALGLFTRVSAVVTALGVTFLHGMFLAPNALNHNWFVAVYALIALCFTRTTDPWSLDYHLAKWRTGSPPQPRGTLDETGLARKALLVLVVGFYFSAGLSKLAVAGPMWADGHTISYFALERGVSRPLGRWLGEHLWLCGLLATGTLLLELGAPAALFSRRARYALLLGWASMHVGIRLAMGPRYWENILCFALLVDWGTALRTVRAKLPVLQRVRFAGHPTPRPHLADPRLARGAMLATLLLPLVLAVAAGRIFWWPLTNVYMYCSYFSIAHDIRADHPRADYYDAVAAQRIARGYLASRPPIEATEYFSFLGDLRLNGGPAGPVSLRSDVPGLASHKQWTLTVLRPVLIADLAAKPEGQIEFDESRQDYPAQQLLLSYLPVLLRHADPALLREHDRIELTYPVGDQPIPIASVPLPR